MAALSPRWTALLGAALVASLAGNAWLWLRAPGAAEAHAPAAAAPASATPARPGAPAVERLPRPALETCNQEPAAARQALATTQEELAQRRDQSARFREGEREEAMEGRLGPAIAAAVTKLPGIVHHEVECRGDLCRVHVSAKTRAEAGEVRGALLKEPRVAEVIDILTVEAGEPVVDLVSGKGAFDLDYYINTSAATDVSPRLGALVDALRSSGVVERCAEASRDPGVLEVKVSVSPDDARLVTALGGTLAGTALGKCISEALLAALAQFTVPPGTKHGTVYASFPSPHGA